MQCEIALPYVVSRMSVGNRVSVGCGFVLGTAPRHASIQPNQNGMMAKGGLMRGENVLGKIQPSERYEELTFVFRRVTWLCE